MAIIDSARRTLAEDPAASMAEIAARAGISRATLHRQFESRALLLRELAARALDLWDTALTAAEAERPAVADDAAVVRAGIETLLRRAVDGAVLAGPALTDEQLDEFPELCDRARRLAERETVLYGRAQAVGVLRGDLPASWIRHSVFGMMVAAREALRYGELGPRAVQGLVVSQFFEGHGTT